MKKLSKLTLALASTLLCFNAAHATSIPNTDDPTTSFAPTVRLGYTTTMSNTSAYSVAGEVGNNNYRIGGTLAWLLDANQRIKVSAEYLWQDIDYAFFSGNQDEWVRQGALGAAYQYDLGYSYDMQFDLNAYLSYAPNINLGTITGIYTDNFGSHAFSDQRRIAGSRAGGIMPGLSIMPWQGGRFGVGLNYDSVIYDTKNGNDQDANGLGGTFKLDQHIMDNLDLGLSAEIRKPFNYYYGSLDWSHVQFGGDWTLGLFGGYTLGKNTLPNTWTAGLSANYMLDQRPPVMVPANLKGEKDVKDVKAEMVAQPINDNLLAWTAKPAVYMPQVLAIADGRAYVCPDGIAPSFSGTIPNDVASGTSVASSFTGNNLTYSLTIDPALISTDTMTISQTGVIDYNTGNAPIGGYRVVVTASNACGSASSNTFLITNND